MKALASRSRSSTTSRVAGIEITEEHRWVYKIAEARSGSLPAGTTAAADVRVFRTNHEVTNSQPCPPLSDK